MAKNYFTLMCFTVQGSYISCSYMLITQHLDIYKKTVTGYAGRGIFGYFPFQYIADPLCEVRLV